MLNAQRLLRFAHANARASFTDDYEVLHLLGKGSSARVFQGFNVLSGQKVVVKMFKHMPEERINKEIDINRRLLAGLSGWNRPAEFIHLLDCLRDATSGTHTLIY